MAERSFRVRHYECDAYGHLNNTMYLRYLEEVEIGAGVVTGRVPDHLDIRYVKTVSFGDTLAVTATGDHHHRAYDYVRVGDRRLVASAAVTWTADHNTAEDPVTAPPRQPAEVFRRGRRIEWQDVDATASVTPATLAAVAEDCGIALCTEYGWPLVRCTEAGFAMVVRRHEIVCGSPARLGDELEITTWASDAARASAIRHYVIAGVDGAEVARFRSHYVWVDVATMRPVRIPADFMADFSANFS